ncbi:mannose/cellobiose epimerase-like protein (N-acyl-D-glucosamine 2-epimerase family) [Pseudomonas sp. BIGb0408]|uniref:Mannose/cellobiose epimerase-like protein (N-acyl-D-glucosamine 2-epimerase family) n=1 Tax=Phytopseudomonas flavescens TaxID=29435 RepID=A0A7Z0BPT3_9GAMM|nr:MULTISPECIES: AGE family epimerase/isomerase [Pseudomonas]MCW2292224.1 mannose/cellobiose epimerase-like protein (N-acyl-D-glucosamine 2-epimerase family) [Pseudomonas sp. BIGb0408]NYH73204.1 mannose/cellobiose epimerase-like protein (N-acyl-D-glucosamine 2-epimerase family) [Pseudomonas flavescens]
MKTPALPSDSWLVKPAHRAWLNAEGMRLLPFASTSGVAQGFAALDGQGRLPAGASAELIHTTRMTHCFALAHIQGIPGYAHLVDHGIATLQSDLRDEQAGGWFADVGRKGDKSAYLHAFVALAASSAQAAGRPGAEALLAEAIGIIERHFWCEEEGALRESFSRDWSQEEAYRGANSNMHATEAFLALADVTGDALWLHRALRIVERLIHHHAASRGYVVVEHFDPQWQALPEYNVDNRADPFRPYGSTPGHSFEWARLLLHLEAALARAGLDAPDWLLEDARGLFASACRDAWHADGAPGLVYSLDWLGRPVVRARLHWVQAEACAAAAALLRRTGEAIYEQWYRRFWEFASSHFIDLQNGSWHHELDSDNHPASSIWPGKPDLYHAYQAVLLPRLPLAPSLASALAAM